MLEKVVQRPAWSKTFIEEPDESRYHSAEVKTSTPWRPIILSILSILGLSLQLCLLLTQVHKIWIIAPVIICAVLAVHSILVKPRRFSLISLVLFATLFVVDGVLLLQTWQVNFNARQYLVIATISTALFGVVVTVNLPMREPSWSRNGISKPFSQPTDKLRSPEDNLTFWQWMTVSWVAPLLSLGRQRQLNEDDIWRLPYEFQHTFLHDAFRQLKGSVLRRLLVANKADLFILIGLETLELITNYSDPILLQQLLKAMQDLLQQKRPALIFASLILLVRVINAQSEVFSLWYQRRAYERSRGELITMLYEKTLHRKVVAQPKDADKEGEENDELARVDTTVSADEATPLIAKKQEEQPNWLRRTVKQLHSVWVNFRIGTKKTDDKKQGPAAFGKILNLMRADAYEVSQRFWEFQDLIEKPFGLLLSLFLIWRLLGWPAFVGIAVIVVAQVINYFLTLVDIRLEKARRITTDKRLQQTSQYVESIRHLRWYGWQNHWLKNVFKARQGELNMRVVSYVWVQLMVLNNVISSGSVIVAAFWAYTSLAKRQLSVDIVFPAIQIFGMVEDNMESLPDLIQALANAYVALKRIQVFMEEPNKLESGSHGDGVANQEITLSNASYAWPGLTESVLHDVNTTFKPGITVVTGEVAAGKTALLLSILGELDILEGEIVKPKSPIAYCAQTPWLQSMTIRDNILFNIPYDGERYRKTLQVCALVHDLASFEKGDLSPIGENGIGLSGGQKMRVALARAVYSDASILLLDDPLSALDQQTSEYIVAECFQGDLLKGRTVVLVTHRTDLCEPIADQIVVLRNGRLTISQSQRQTTNGHVANGSAGNGALVKSNTKELQEAIPDKFEEEEHRQHGDIRARVYWEYIKAGNISAWFLIIFAIALVRLTTIGENWYLKEFSEAYGDTTAIFFRPSQYQVYADIPTTKPSLLDRLFDRFPDPRRNVSPWLVGLLCITLAQALSLLLSRTAILTTRYLSGKNLFRAVMHKITGTTFRYYDITPVGRLMNRLTSDISQLDSGIGADLYMFLWYTITWVFSIGVIATVTPVFLAVSVLVTASFVWIFFLFLPTSQSLRRLETVSLSPLMTNFGALLQGLTTVRAFRAESRFQAKLVKVVDTFQGMDHFYWSVQSWLSYRLEIMSAISTFGLTTIAIYTNLSAGLTAFVLVSAQKFVTTTHQLCRTYGRLQVNFVSVERVVELLDLEQEPTNPVPPPAWWPSFSGSIVFENVTIRYAPHLEPALTDVSFELKGGTNTAIVGRTGSGKSTLAAALLATVPVEKGRILIDGVDLATVDRQALRTRITFLAQEPVLFEGTLRHNLDPTHTHSDADCANVIARVADRFGWTLSTMIETGGKNLSQGQRQLVGLARAILRRSSIIIMDEATASIDVDTAWAIQRVLREELKGSTVITIAHRTAAVRDADQSIVLANGKLESFGPVSASSGSTSADES